MKRSTVRNILFFLTLAVCVVLAVSSAGAQPSRTGTARHTVPALMLSDIHFDPFHDPGKTARLVAAPISEWGEILAEPPSADQVWSFAALQQRCGARGVDTPYALLQSSLQTAHRAAPNAAFATVSGDLIAHGFACRFAAVFPGRAQDDYTAFVEKTVEYVTTELRNTFPGVPVYVALGNNDSNCGDNRIDQGSEFLAAVAKSVMAGWPKSMDPADRKKAMADFAAGGYYSVMMAAPMRNTRLIVLDDVFMSTVYATCGGKPDNAAAAAQITWLRKELDGARQRRERVWVMGHIPPGVDIYSTFSKIRNLCGGDAPVMFLSSDELGKVLTENSDVVRLGIFAHTHMDEVRLLEPEGGAKGGMVAIKLIASISPVNGNHPSFTVAQVDTAAAMLRDYTVFAASNLEGDGAWSKEYDYAQKYHAAAFSSAALKKLIGDFQGDPNATTQASRAYIGNFVVGDNSSLIKPLWPQYVCGLSHATAKGFVRCMCPTMP
jgi:sphingomyelin phosphodiesterase acid-like 3